MIFFFHRYDCHHGRDNWSYGREIHATTHEIWCSRQPNPRVISSRNFIFTLFNTVCYVTHLQPTNFIREKPRINSSTVDLKWLSTLPAETLGRKYIDFLEKNVRTETRQPGLAILFGELLNDVFLLIGTSIDRMWHPILEIWWSSSMMWN